jgi:hypothetical protein
VRFGLLILTFFVVALPLRGQEQERKLVDRLLSPDARLANADQNKKFLSSAESPTRQAATKSFFVPEKNLSKNFVAADHSASATSFRTGNYSTKGASIPALRATKAFQTKTAEPASAGAYSTKQYGTRNFAGNRPFLAQGKSQKSLHAQDRPLTIDEVRELLNKNK